jgi:hypothetical protein
MSNDMKIIMEGWRRAVDERTDDPTLFVQGGPDSGIPRPVGSEVLEEQQQLISDIVNVGYWIARIGDPTGLMSHEDLKSSWKQYLADLDLSGPMGLPTNWKEFWNRLGSGFAVSLNALDSIPIVAFFLKPVTIPSKISLLLKRISQGAKSKTFKNIGLNPEIAILASRYSKKMDEVVEFLSKGSKQKEDLASFVFRNTLIDPTKKLVGKLTPSVLKKQLKSLPHFENILNFPGVAAYLVGGYFMIDLATMIYKAANFDEESKEYKELVEKFVDNIIRMAREKIKSELKERESLYKKYADGNPKWAYNYKKTYLEPLYGELESPISDSNYYEFREQAIENIDELIKMLRKEGIVDYTFGLESMLAQKALELDPELDLKKLAKPGTGPGTGKPFESLFKIPMTPEEYVGNLDVDAVRRWKEREKNREKGSDSAEDLQNTLDQTQAY